MYAFAHQSLAVIARHRVSNVTNEYPPKQSPSIMTKNKRDCFVPSKNYRLRNPRLAKTQERVKATVIARHRVSNVTNEYPPKQSHRIMTKRQTRLLRSLEELRRSNFVVGQECPTYLPFTVHRLPFTVYRSPFTVYRLPFTVYRLPFTVHRLPFTAYRSPFTAYRLPVETLASQRRKKGLRNRHCETFECRMRQKVSTEAIPTNHD